MTSRQAPSARLRACAVIESECKPDWSRDARPYVWGTRSGRLILSQGGRNALTTEQSSSGVIDQDDPKFTMQDWLDSASDFKTLRRGEVIEGVEGLREPAAGGRARLWRRCKRL